MKKYSILGVVEAGDKAPFPQQPHCIGKECPRTLWDDDWDKKQGEEALVRTIILVAQGQADTGKESKDNKSKKVEVKKVPSDPSKYFKPVIVANSGCVDGGSADNKADEVEGLSPLGASQIKSLVNFYLEEFGGTQIHMIVHGTGAPAVATAKMMENQLEKSRQYSKVETSLLDPLLPPLPGQEPDDPHPGDLARLEAVFRKYFHRLPDDDSQDSSELDVIVCPPKLVGYFICRFLQAPPDRFTSWGIANASLTELLVYRNGRVGVHRAGDIGFMSPKDVTYE